MKYLPFESAVILQTLTFIKWSATCNKWVHVPLYRLPGGSVVKSPPANAGDSGSSSGLGGSPGEGSSNTVQYPCQGNP